MYFPLNLLNIESLTCYYSVLATFSSSLLITFFSGPYKLIYFQDYSTYILATFGVTIEGLRRNIHTYQSFGVYILQSSEQVICIQGMLENSLQVVGRF